MLRRHIAAVLSATLLSCCATTTAFSQNQGYPTVIGASGQPYGPTQAEYQYQMRYGRPSPGNRGGDGLRYVNGYPGPGGGGGGYGWGGYNPFLFMDVGPYVAPPTNGYVYYPSTAYYGNFGSVNYGLPMMQPYLNQPVPQAMQPFGGNPSAIFGNGSATYTQFPAITQSAPVIAPSSPKAVETSFEFQTSGDLQLQQLNYLAASERYRKAINAARDRADPRYRVAVTLAARGRFLEAVDQLRLATQIDPTWPQHASSLDELFGAQNTFEKTRVKERIAEWTLQDARDPNRLFLLGAMLYMDHDPNAKTMIDTAILIAGQQEHLLAFTTPRSIHAGHGAQGKENQNPNGKAPGEAAQHKPPQPQLPLPAKTSDPQPTPQGAPPSSLPARSEGKPIPALPPLPENGTGASSDPLPPPNSDAREQGGLQGPLLPPLP